MKSLKHFYTLNLTWPVLISGLLLLTVSACEERFNPEIDPKYENTLVVEGEISNAPGPYSVKLSYSGSLESNQVTPVTAAMVEIIDNLDNHEVLTETIPGTYMTNPEGIRGQEGRLYKIRISLPDGKTYNSDFQKLRTPPVIKSIDYEIEYQSDVNLPFDLGGYRFFANTEIPSGDTVYYLWKLTATYKYAVDLIIRWMYDGQLHPFTNFDSLRYCWTTSRINSYYLFNNENLNISTLAKFPLHFVGTDVRDLSIRYSLLTEQLSISKEAYEFWSIVKEQNENVDDLYSKQPYQLRGNVYNADNINEPVLGYFMVAGKSENRIFVNRPDYPLIMQYPECKLVEQDYMNFGILFYSSPAEWPEFATFDNNGVNAYPPQSCLDCRENGGTIEIPDFWIDN
ncbi:MAG: DUF4249 domain-containing protein [Bacteroidales bacterium]|nr:DUF4249 domain-containing protein [Bacteroidales bacterium]